MKLIENNYKLNLRTDWEYKSRRVTLCIAGMSLFKAGYILVNMLICALAWGFHSNYGLFAQTTLLLIIIFGTLTYILINTYNGFQVGLRTVEDLAISQSLALILSSIGVFLVETLLLKRIPNLWFTLVAIIAHIGWSMIWCMIADRLFYYLFPALRTAIVYQYKEALESIEGVYHNEKRFNVVKTIDASAGANAVQAKLSDIDAVFLCGMPSSIRNDILKFCIERGIRAYVRPKLSDVILSSAVNMQMFHVPVLFCRRRIMPLSFRMSKRAIDILFAIILLSLASPFMLITAVAIKLHDQGPVLYKQKRITRNGKIFEIIKFRSMIVDAENDGRARLASEGDDRITPVGRVIRKARIDELPQLFNILRGDMSFVGPRPERPEIAEQYAAILPEYDLRLQIKAGLTGFAQVHGKYNTSPYDKLQMDLMYIAHQSLITDIKLILQTAKVLLSFEESTQGVAAGQVTAMHEKTKESA